MPLDPFAYGSKPADNDKDSAEAPKADVGVSTHKVTQAPAQSPGNSGPLPAPSGTPAATDMPSAQTPPAEPYVPLLERRLIQDITDPPAPFELPMPPAFAKKEPATTWNWLTHSHDKWDQDRQRHEEALTYWEEQRGFSASQVAEYHRFIEEMRAAMAEVDHEMWENCRRDHLVVGVTHNKGGVGKTPTAVNLAARAAQGTNLNVILYDGNPDMGGSALRSGINPDQTLTLSEYFKIHDKVDHAELCRRMPPTRHGVLVVAADPDEIARSITPEETRLMLESLKKHANIIIVDLGTGVSTPVNEVVHKMADVFAMPMLTLMGVRTTAGAVDGRNSTQKRLMAQSENDPSDPHRLVALKAQFSVTFAIGIKQPSEIDAFQAAIGADNLMVPIPFDPASYETTPVWHPNKEGDLGPRRDRVSARTALAWGKGINTLYSQAATIRELTAARLSKAQSTASNGSGNGSPSNPGRSVPYASPDPTLSFS